MTDQYDDRKFIECERCHQAFPPDEISENGMCWDCDTKMFGDAADSE